MATGSDNKFPKVILEEVANDGSATTTPAADHRSLFLGEDGGLHLKDSAAAVTDIVGAGAHIADGSAAHAASAVSFSPTGTIAATDVQAAIAEVASEAAGGSAPVPWGLYPHVGIAHTGVSVVGAANRAIRVPATLYAATTITGIQIRVGTQNGNICVGLYNSSDARVATSGSVACPATGIQTVAFTGNYSAAAGRYWLAISTDSATASFSRLGDASTAAPAPAQFMNTAFVLPDPFVSAGPTAVHPNLVGMILTVGYP